MFFPLKLYSAYSLVSKLHCPSIPCMHFVEGSINCLLQPKKQNYDLVCKLQIVKLLQPVLCQKYYGLLEFHMKCYIVLCHNPSLLHERAGSGHETEEAFKCCQHKWSSFWFTLPMLVNFIVKNHFQLFYGGKNTVL